MTAKGQTLKIHGRVWYARIDADDTIKIGPLRPSDFRATERNTMQCVVARAMKRHKQANGWELINVWVGANVVDAEFKEDPDVLYRYFLSPEDIKRVATFDKHPEAVKDIGAWVKGITVTLVPPPETKQLGYKHGKSGTNKRKANPSPKQPMRHLFTEPS